MTDLREAAQILVLLEKVSKQVLYPYLRNLSGILFAGTLKLCTF